MSYLGYVIEIYGDYGWENAVVWAVNGFDDEEIIFRSEKKALKQLSKMKKCRENNEFDFRITTTIQLH
jgi:hypothetical protein